MKRLTFSREKWRIRFATIRHLVERRREQKCDKSHIAFDKRILNGASEATHFVGKFKVITKKNNK